MKCDRDKNGLIDLKRIGEPGGIVQRMALIRFYLHERPKNITEFAEAWNQLSFALQFDGKLRVTEKIKG